jgi:hypothetical protein
MQPQPRSTLHRCHPWIRAWWADVLLRSIVQLAPDRGHRAQLYDACSGTAADQNGRSKGFGCFHDEEAASRQALLIRPRQQEGYKTQEGSGNIAAVSTGH